MIVLDTNVVSEIVRSDAHPNVLRWVASLPGHDACITAITLAELMAGIAVLPMGRRRSLLTEEVRAVVAPFRADERILAFDAAAASYYSSVVAARREAGRPIATADAQIAAICLAHDLTCATRNVRDFEGTGIRVLNPWVTE